MRIFFFLLMIFWPFFSFAADEVPASTAPTASTVTPPAAAVTAPPPDVSATTLEAIGQVIWAKGKVSAALPDQEKRALSRRSSVYQKDTLESEKASSAQINFTDGSLLALTENTKLILENYNYNKAEPSEDSFVMTITKGGLRTVTGEISKNNPSGYKTKTPVATLSVSGTEYSIIVKENNDTLVAVKKGKITATNAQGKTVTLDAFDQRYAMINEANAEVLKTMPQEFKSLDGMKLETKNINKQSPRSGSTGGFCVGK